MKNNKLIYGLILPLLLAGCSIRRSSNTNSSGSTSFSSEVNYDSDDSELITSDSGSNDYDSHDTTSEDVDEPDSYDTFTDCTIDAAGNYYLKGEYSSISITAAKNSELYIFLDGVTINSSTGIAFGSSKAITLHLVLLNGSENTIINDFTDTNAFHIKGDVLISGEGTLNITSKQKNGLKVSKDLYVYEGVTLNVKGANHAIAARSLTSNGASINVTTEEGGKDGVQLECDSDVIAFTKEQGFAYLVNTNFTSDTYGDGIQADTFVYISGGTYNMTTHGVFVSYSTTNMTTYGLTTDDFKFVKSGDTYKRVATDEIRNLSSSYYALTQSVKGIKAGIIEYDSDSDDVDDKSVTTGDYDIYIAHLANITINSTDDCIHTNYGDLTLTDCNLTLATLDDGAHADYNLNVNNASINITSSYEGLEGAAVTVSGADTNIVSVSGDDGINAASDLTSTNTIVINDGYLRVYASGDGLDANTSLTINGGTVIVEGPGSGNGSLDADKINFNGGIVFACSTSGMRESMTAKQYTFVWQGSTIASNTKVSIVNSSNEAIFTYTLKQSCNQIIFSHPSMVSGGTYQIYSGSTSLASITMTSTLVTSGSSQGGPGGGGHGGH